MAVLSEPLDLTLTLPWTCCTIGTAALTPPKCPAGKSMRELSRRSALGASAAGLLAASSAARPARPALATPPPAVQPRKIKPQLAAAMTRSVYDAVIALQVRAPEQRVIVDMSVEYLVGRV